MHTQTCICNNWISLFLKSMVDMLVKIENMDKSSVDGKLLTLSNSE